MKRTFIFLIYFFCAICTAEGQSKLIQASPVRDFSKESRPSVFIKSEVKRNLSGLKQHSKQLLLTLDFKRLKELTKEKGEILELTIPGIDETLLELELHSVSIMAPDIDFKNTFDIQQAESLIQESSFYRGIIKGNDKSLVALSIVNEEVSGMIIDSSGTRLLGKNFGRSVTENSYLMYYEDDLADSHQFMCNSAETEEFTKKIGNRLAVDPDGSCKYLGIYLETDKSVYDKFGTKELVTSYILGVFNQVAMLYSAENIALRISGLYIWDTTDPYAGSQNNTTDALSRFQNNWNGKSNAFPGQLAHLISCRPLGGGQAHLGVLDNRSMAYGVSALRGTYQQIPTYSWDVKVLAHEFGHNIGSPHTHSCTWPGGPIDNCGAVEGSCEPGPTPVNGGTIMSYCQNTSIGINLAQGFGLLPGNLIRSKIAEAVSLPTSNAVPTGLVSTTFVRSARLKWEYTGANILHILQYKTPGSASWMEIQTTKNEILLSGLTPNTAYQWRVKGNCSEYTPVLNFATNENQPLYCQPKDLCVKEIGIGVDAISLAGVALSVASSCAVDGYSFNTKIVPQLKVGEAATMSISLINYSYPQYVKAWIDYNNDGEFADNEIVIESASFLTSSLAASFTVPVNQVLLTTRVRVRTNYYYKSFNACENLSLGETEDYLVSFIPAPPLPVKFVSFNASKESGNAVLKWETVDEDPGFSFEIERSINARDFYKTGNVLGKGPSTKSNIYTYKEGLGELDALRVYYRIKMPDGLGNYIYSRITHLMLNNLSESSVSIWPNPFRNILNFSVNYLNKGLITIKLYNSSGAAIRQYHHYLSRGNLSIQIENTNDIPAGTYIIEISDQVSFFSKTLIKQN